MRFQHFQIPETAKADWLNLCGDNAYAVVNANRIPAPLSNRPFAEMRYSFSASLRVIGQW